MGLALPSSALAQGATERGYSFNDSSDPGSTFAGSGGGTGDPAGVGDPGSAANTVTETSGGSLPFSGLDLFLIAGAGTVLLVLGFGMRHMTRRPEGLPETA